MILLGGDLGWERGWVRPTNLHYILESPPRLAPKFRLRMRWRLIRVAQTSHNRVSGPWPEDDKVRRQAFCAAAHLRRHAPSGTRSLRRAMWTRKANSPRVSARVLVVGSR